MLEGWRRGRRSIEQRMAGMVVLECIHHTLVIDSKFLPPQAWAASGHCAVCRPVTFLRLDHQSA